MSPEGGRPLRQIHEGEPGFAFFIGAHTARPYAGSMHEQPNF